MKNFNHLTVPDHWQQYWSRYPEGYTMLESLINWVGHVDKLTDNVNDVNDYLKGFAETFDKELQTNIVNTLKEWQESGFLKVVIDQALQTQIDDVSGEVVDLIVRIDDLAISVKNYGAKGDGITDDSIAIQNAINATPDGGKLFFPTGTYIISTPPTITKSIHLRGRRGKSTVKIKDATRVRHLFFADGVKEVTAKGITFDMNMQLMPIYDQSEYLDGSFNQAIHLRKITDVIEITKCTFKNLYNEAVWLYDIKCPITRITDNLFTSPPQQQNLRATHINLQTISNSGTIVIEKNVFDNVKPYDAQYGVNAIFAEGVKSKTSIKDNKLNYCGRNNVGQHRLLPIDLYGNCNYFTISDNLFTNCLWGFVRLESSQDCIVEKNKFYYNSGQLLADPGIWINATDVYAQWGKNVKILNNEFYAAGNSRIVNLIAIWTLDWTRTVENIEVEGNSFFGNIDYPVTITAGIDTVKIRNNHTFPYDGYTPKKLVNVVRDLNNPTGSEANSKLKGLVIANNECETSEGTISINLTTYTGKSDQIIIDSNKFKGVQGFGSGILARNAPVTIKNNFLSENTEGVYIVGNKRAYVLDNIVENMQGGAFALTEATNAIQARNYYNGTLV